MNVFILSSGRCGSLTFSIACKHISNFTAGHETLVQKVGADRLNYPANHIEVDNRLSWMLGRLDQKYGPDAFYVHLYRDQAAVAASYDKRWEHAWGIAGAYRNGVLMLTREAPRDCLDDMIETISANIRGFLKDKPNKMDFRLEDAAEAFPSFWRQIGAEGDLSAAMLEWRTPNNASLVQRPKPFLRNVRNVARRSLAGLSLAMSRNDR